MKLTASVSAFFLVLGLMLMGVFAVEKATVNMGGSISFTATDIYARVTGSIANAQGEYADYILPTLEFSAESDTPDQSGWSNLNLNFDDQATPIEVTIKVENLSAQNTLRVNLNDTITSTVANFKKEVKVVGSDDLYQNASDITLQPDTGSTDNETTFTITFSVENKNNSVSADFNYQINLFDQYYVPETYEDFSFSIDEAEKTATVTGYTGTDTDVVIPSSISLGGKNEITNFRFSNFYSMNQLLANTLYLAKWNYTDGNGEKGIITNADQISGTLHPASLPTPVDVEVEYQVELNNEDLYINTSSLSEYLNYFEQLKASGNIEGGFYATVGGERTLFSTVDEFIERYPDTTQIFPITLELENPIYNGRVCVEGNDYTVTNIEGYAFRDVSLNSITLSESISYLSNNAFYLSTIDTIYLNSNLSSCGNNGVFSGITAQSIIVGDNVTSIPDYLFYPGYHSSHLISELIFMPNSQLKSIGNYAFYYFGGYSFETLDLTNCKKLTNIGDYAFYYCYVIKIEIPGSVNSIGQYAFKDCHRLQNLIFSDNSQLTSIGSYAFNGCRSLTNVTFGDNSQLTSIGDDAFRNCTSLTSVDLGECTKLTSIGSYAFEGCSSLTSVTINEYVFRNVTSSSSSCGYIFSNISSGETVRVPANLIDDLKLTNTYLDNTTYFTRSESAVDGYYVYTRV